MLDFCGTRLPTVIHPLTTWLAAAVVLCAPAIWNGLPLLFDDVGGYLWTWPSRTLANGRAVPYGLLLWATMPLAWVPVVVIQAVVTVWMVARMLDAFGYGARPWLVLLTVSALTLTSGVALFVSQTMPDAWAAPAVLALVLLTWRGNRFGRMERLALSLVVAFAGAIHMATFALLAGLALVQSLAALFRRPLGIAPQRLLYANMAVLAGLFALLGANAAVTGRLALTPGGTVFFVGRMLESGLLHDVLEHDCPRADWRLCAMRGELGRDRDVFLWNSRSPLHALGGWDDPEVQREFASIIRRSLALYPLGHLRQALLSTVQQFRTAGVGDSTGALTTWKDLRWLLERFAPHLVHPYEASRQARGELVFERWSAVVVTPVALAGSMALLVLCGLLWREGHRERAMLCTMLLLALVGNAFVCGTFSGPAGRYQARVAWLAPFVGLLGLAAQIAARPAREGSPRA